MAEVSVEGDELVVRLSLLEQAESLHGGVRVPRGVAIVTQSGNIGVNLTMQRRGLPIAYLCTLGNQAVELRRDYGTCPRCGSGLFPPGR